MARHIVLEHRSRGTTAVLSALAILGALGTAGGTASAQTTAADASSGPWTLSTTNPTSNYAPAFIGNGYFAARVPAQGTGYSPSPVTTQAELAGFYADPPGAAEWIEQRATLPMWTTLGFTSGTDSVGNLPVCTFDRACEAALGELSGGAQVANDHSGSTGGSFVAGLGVNNQPDVGATVTVPITQSAAGAAQVGIRYSNGNSSSETVSYSLNGGTAQQLTLPTTGNWNTWSTVSVPAGLTAGTNDFTITVRSGDTGQVNIDTMAAYPTGGSVPTVDAAAQQGTMSNYNQTLDMSTGTLTTSYTWTAPSGDVTAITYTVNADQSNGHVGMVSMSFTPQWSGTATITDALDQRSLGKASAGNAAVNGSTGTLTETVTAQGTGVTAALASVLSVDGKVADTTSDGPAAQGATLSVKAGTTYTATKYVGVAASNDTDRTVSAASPQAYALSQASTAAQLGSAGVSARNSKAWSTLWSADISVPGNDSLTGQIRASMFYLLESTRAGVNWSTTPGGLSSDAYNGHVFWDMETWMYPALLALHPDIAQSQDAYRQMLLPQAEKNGATCAPAGQTTSGARFPWESGLTGVDAYTGPGESCDEIHITADIALAQWQYYEATGNTTWLADNAWPVISQAADYYASRATPDTNGGGGYQILDVMGPDEYADGVNDDAYTNDAAQETLQIAIEAAQLTGNTANPAWATVSKGLAAPFNASGQYYLEHDGYSGQTVKQADVTMLQYPWNVSMSPTVAQNDLNYYQPLTDTSGPSMTNSIAAIDSAALPSSGCSDYTYLESSVNPYMEAPFDQFTETPGGGAFDFTTGAGGFLQEFEYGFTGLRWNQNSVQIDPSLPPQLPGLDLSGLQWHGSTYNLSITPTTTTVTVTSGPAMPVTDAGGTTQTVASGATLTVPTRVPTSTTDIAQCKPVTASSQSTQYPAAAAVDGDATTAWHATASGANLTVDLSTATSLDQVQVVSQGSTTAYSIQGSNDDTTWTTLASQAATTATTTTVTFPSGSYRYVRYQAASTATAQVESLTVAPATGPIHIALQGLCLDVRSGLTADFNPVQVYTCNGTASQQWTVESNGSLQAFGKCLDAYYGGTANGTLVELYTCNGTGAQVWNAQSNGELLNPQSGKCLDDTASGGSGTQLELYTCTDNTNQQWSLP